MILDLRRSAVATAVIVALAATASDQWEREPAPEYSGSANATSPIRSAEEAIAHWPEAPRLLAGVMIEKYGAPDETVPSQLSWNDRPPWTTVTVFRDPQDPRRSDHLLESVAYGKVPFDRWRELVLFGRGAAYDPATQELAARTNGEETNFLALNLADEIARGRLSASAARRGYDAALNFSFSGKKTPYMSGLLFRPRAPRRRVIF